MQSCTGVRDRSCSGKHTTPRTQGLQDVQLQEMENILQWTSEDVKRVLTQIEELGKSMVRTSVQTNQELSTVKLDVQLKLDHHYEQMLTQQKVMVQNLQKVLDDDRVALQNISDIGVDEVAMENKPKPPHGNLGLDSREGSKDGTIAELRNHNLSEDKPPLWADDFRNEIVIQVKRELERHRDGVVEMLPQMMARELNTYEDRMLREMGRGAQEQKATDTMAELRLWKPSPSSPETPKRSQSYQEDKSESPVPRRVSIPDDLSHAANDGAWTRSKMTVSLPDDLPPALNDAAWTSARTAQSTQSGMSTATTGTPVQSKIIFNRRKKRLHKALSINEELEARVGSSRTSTDSTPWMPAKSVVPARTRMEFWMDEFMVFLIVLNAICIGFSVDSQEVGEWNVWQMIDILFAAVFVLELIIKLSIHGVREHFYPPDFDGHLEGLKVFDACIVIFDVAQVILGIITNSQGSATGRFASLFRLVRLIRVLKILRVFRSTAMKGMFDMIQGVVHGSLTLLWAVVLFFLIVYVFAVFCRVVIGEADETSLEHYFANVPRSMMTIFRCSFGDCTTKYGNSIPEIITSDHGGGFSFAYCMFLFIVTIGLFNIISAIFVEATVTAASRVEIKEKQARLDDPERYARSVATMIRKVLTVIPGANASPGSLADAIDDYIHLEITRDEFDEIVLADPAVINALERLDIDMLDHRRLSDILDPDHSGNIGMMELVEGLRRLRGSTRRSDVVSIDLMVRVLQERVDEVLEILKGKGHRRSSSPERV